MKSQTHLGRRDMLALFATCLLPALPVSQGPTIDARPAAPVDRIKIRLTAGPPGASPLLAEVRSVLRPTLAAHGNGSLLNRVRKALDARYGSQLSESALPPTYVWVWNGERWIWVCLSASTFEVDFGARGVIEVDVEDGTSMR